MKMAPIAVTGLPLGLLALLAGCAAAVSEGPAATFRNPAAAEATTWLPEGQPDRRIRYAGHSPVQYGDLRLPAGRAPPAGHPVAVVIHGGAWQADWTSDYTSRFAEALTDRGIATWNIEFRRIGNRGAGYPGTFTDVGLATDFLRTLAEAYPLDLDRVVVVGHSSGGHLGLWLAGRRNLPESSGLRGPDPLPLAGVISLAGVNDLEGALALGNRTDVLALIGTGTATAGTRLATTSPGRLLPLGTPQVLIVGTGDEAWRIEVTRRYAAAAAAAGDQVELLILDGANHADVVDPYGPAPAMTARAVFSLVNPEQRSRHGRRPLPHPRATMHALVEHMFRPLGRSRQRPDLGVANSMPPPTAPSPVRSGADPAHAPGSLVAPARTGPWRPAGTS